jgi:hypothetical protein
MTRMIDVARPALLAAVLATCVGCRDPFVGCEPARPRVLPDGSTPETVARSAVRGHQPELVWGSERGEVHAIGFHPADAGPDIGSEAPGVTVRGRPARITDQSEAVPAIAWRADGCEYHIWLDPTLTRREVIEYAGRY